MWKLNVEFLVFLIYASAKTSSDNIIDKKHSKDTQHVAVWHLHLISETNHQISFKP